MKIGAKTLRNNFRMKATANEFDVTTKPSQMVEQRINSEV